MNAGARVRYGRTVAVVILPDGRSLNAELVRAGLAWWYRRYAPDDETLERLEREAREARRGLWGDPEPIPPWEWRRGTRSGAAAGCHRSFPTIQAIPWKIMAAVGRA